MSLRKQKRSRFPRAQDIYTYARRAPNSFPSLRNLSSCAMPLCKCCSGRGSSLTAAVALLLTACAGLLLAYPARDAVAGLIRAGVRGYSVLDSTSAGGWPGWLDSRDPSAGQVTSRYYVFNITNVEAVLKGAKPDVQQVSARRRAIARVLARVGAARAACWRCAAVPRHSWRTFRAPARLPVDRLARWCTTTSTPSTTTRGSPTARK